MDKRNLGEILRFFSIKINKTFFLFSSLLDFYHNSTQPETTGELDVMIYNLGEISETYDYLVLQVNNNKKANEKIRSM
jgi:hypothetical protein